MARFAIRCVASLTALCVAGAMPLLADEEVGTAVISDCPCPPVPPPLYDYPPPPTQRYMPAPMERGTPAPPPKDMDKLPIAPPPPRRPSDSGQPSDADQSSDFEQPSDIQQPFDMQAPQMTDFPTQSPDLATPTFNPSSPMPTTAATSADAMAPNLMGDLFGTSFSGTVPVVIDNFYGISNFSTPSPDFDTGSSLSYSTTTDSGSTFRIARTTDPLNALQTITGPNITVTTSESQSAIANADSSLTSPVAIINSSAVQSHVETYAESLHGEGEAVFLPEESFMLLDPLGGGGPSVSVGDPEAFWNYNYVVMSEVAGISNLGGAPGANVGRQKLAENSSPFPQDRVFVNYSYFRNTPLVADGLNVHRVTPGFEKTFFRGNASVEVRAPFASTLDSDIIAGGATDTSTAEFGNLTVYFKALLWDAGYEALSAGFGLSFPTASDVLVRDVSGNAVLEVQNDSIHVLPFIGGLYMPTERCFIQGLAQMDIDPNGNPVRFTTFNNGNPTGILAPAGRPNDADYVFLTFNIGYWIYRAPVPNACCCDNCSAGYGHGWIQGIAPTFELHYNATVNAADNVTAQRGTSTIRLGDGSRSEIDLWNVVLGTTFQCHHNATLTLGYATPIGDRDDQQFDSEFRAIFNWYFGGPDRVHTCRLCRF